MLRYDVFLSHASTDKPTVEHLAHRLREVGVKLFLDKWHLIPAQQEALEEALGQSRTCAVFIGKELGPWQNEEMRVSGSTSAATSTIKTPSSASSPTSEEKLPVLPH